MSSPSRSAVVPPARRATALGCVLATVLAAGATVGVSRSADGDDGSSAAVTSAGAPERVDVAEDDPAGDAARLVSRSGDRWSAAYSAQEYEALRLSLEGEYIGTGIAVNRTPDGRIEVSRVRPGSPAERVGIRAGDTLRTVDGVPLDGRPVTDAVAKLRGSDKSAGPGSAVLLGLEREGQHWESAVERARIATESVFVSRDLPAVTRIRVTAFTQGTAELLRAAVESAPADDGVLLDLRGNAGGLISEAALAASVFLDGGVVATYDVHGSQRALLAESGGRTGTPLVVLVDGGTMSSAELLAGTLKDRNRAVVVGRPTFGKGTVQMPVEQPDGSVAELTVGQFVMPSGGVVEEGRGIVPDVVVEAGEDAGTRAAGVLAGLRVAS
ncbi:S41 family peptidase [Streptomyces sp. ACA25]|uniref:S41 family peptidase n=1 Tax=Streptomyces sp. ACA25 TaxID=3022596 RepID=UPI002307B0D3|nr:S41 family peptidase [Streptomyces sp. ACA25]MDB1089479.1 S41 family peptidase [Streptomyces sp. ACA25]